ncbi:MAG: DUF2071 domain-containing protein, partial [Minicystis sp.]
GESLGSAAIGTFEHFLAERYILFSKHGDKLEIGRVHHKPYPLHRAELLELSHSMVRVQGLPQSDDPPLILYSPGVDVDVFDLVPVRG